LGLLAADLHRLVGGAGYNLDEVSAKHCSGAAAIAVAAALA
jgi:hypothetical protein